MVSARRGWGTQRANPRAPAVQRLCPSTLRGTCTQRATTRALDAFRGMGSGTQGTNPGPLWHNAVVRLRPGDPAPSGPPLGPCGAGYLGLTHTETQRGRLWTA